MKQHRSGATLVFLIVMLLIDVVLALVASSSNGMRGGMELMFGGGISGVFCGQCVFAYVWSGLIGNSWLRSYFQAVGMAAVAVFLVVMATFFGLSSAPRDWSRPFNMLLFIPLFGIIGSVPLWAVRYLLGWRLLPGSQTTEKSKAVGVGDILLLTSTVAGAIMLTRAAIVLMNAAINTADSTWRFVLITAVIQGAVSAPFSLGSAWIFFGSESSQSRFLKMAGFGLATWIVSVVTIVMLASGGGAGEVIVVLMFLVVAGFGTLIFGLECLNSDGFELHRRVKTQVSTAPSVIVSENAIASLDSLSKSSSPLTASDPFSVEESVESSQDVVKESTKYPHLDRVLVGAFVGIAVFFTAMAHRKESREQGVLRAQEESLSSLRNQATEVVVENGDDVERFRGKPIVDDSIADELDSYPGLKVVDLTGCKNITDRGATQIAKLPSLDRLILAGTSVSDNLFESINPGEFSLRELDLSHTNVTVAGIKKMFGIIRCQKLSLRGLNLSDPDIKQLEMLSCDEWDLRDNPISVVPARARSLAVGRSSIDAAQLSGLARSLTSLKIDGMKISDDDFISLLDELPALQFLSVKDTGLTDTSLDRIGKNGTLIDLEIGPGNFAGNNVFPANLHLRRLKISHPKMNLGLLASLGPMLDLVDLSASGVTDSDILAIQNLMHVSYKLDRTQVTIKSIEHLAGLQAREISFKGTAITPTEIGQIAKDSFFTRLIVDETVFTDQVKKKLRRDYPIRFENNLSFEFDDGY